jgi:hypothetical protein
VGRLGLSDEEENALISFMQTLTDGFMQGGQQWKMARRTRIRERLGVQRSLAAGTAERDGSDSEHKLAGWFWGQREKRGA